MQLLPLASEPFTAPTDRDMLPSERREFVRTHRTCVFGYRRRNDGPVCLLRPLRLRADALADVLAHETALDAHALRRLDPVATASRRRAGALRHRRREVALEP